MFSVLSLYKGHFKNSKKILFYSSIGLIISLTLVSSSLYFIDNSRQELINNDINPKAHLGNDIVAQLTTNFEVANTSDRINKISNSISGVVDKYNFGFINQSEIKVSAGYGNIQIVLPVTSLPGNGAGFPSHYLESSPTLVYQLTPFFKQELEQLHSSNPQNSSIQFPKSQSNLNDSSLEAFMVYIDSPYNYFNPLNTNSMVKKGNLTVYFSSANQFGNFSNFNFSVVDYAMYKYNPYYNFYYNPNGVEQSPVQSSYTPFLEGLVTGNMVSANQRINYFFSSNVQGTTSAIRSIIFVSNITQFGQMIKNSYRNLTPSITNNYIVHIGFNYKKIDLTQIDSF